MPAFLIVRLGALGDIVHALPAAAALRAAFPDARIDWLAADRHRAILELVPVVDRRLLVFAARGGVSPAAEEFAGVRGVAAALHVLRARRYDVAFDFQGLLKSAVLARLSGARRVVGFSAPYLRERLAHLFYTETVHPAGHTHVIDKNLALIEAVGIREAAPVFPLERRPSAALEEVRRQLAAAGAPAFVLLNPGAGWPNKRWPPERFAAVAAVLHTRLGLRSVVLWGSGEEGLAREVVERSGGTAALAPPTTVADVVSLAAAARLMIAGDTGPLHLAAAVGTPIVGIYGPTNPARNGSWNPADESLTRFERCACHHKRRCRRRSWCLLEISVDDVVAAAGRRLAAGVEGTNA